MLEMILSPQRTVNACNTFSTDCVHYSSINNYVLGHNGQLSRKDRIHLQCRFVHVDSR